MIIELVILGVGFLLLLVIPWWLLYFLLFCSLGVSRGYAALGVSIVLDVVVVPDAFPYLSVGMLVGLMLAGWLRSRVLPT